MKERTPTLRQNSKKHDAHIAKKARLVKGAKAMTRRQKVPRRQKAGLSKAKVPINARLKKLTLTCPTKEMFSIFECFFIDRIIVNTARFS